MYIVEVRPAKEIGDYLFNWYYPNIYLVDDSGKEECISPSSILFEPTMKDLPPSIASSIRDLSDNTKKLIEQNKVQSADTIPKIEASVRSITELLESIEEMSSKVTNIAATTEEISAQSESIQTRSEEIQVAVENI